MTDLDTVAKAIANAQGVFDYWNSEHCPQGTYRKMAQVAIDALQLKEEKERDKKCVCRHSHIDHDMYRDGKCGANMVTRHTPCPCAQWEPQKRVRLVSPWVRVEEQREAQEG